MIGARYEWKRILDAMLNVDHQPATTVSSSPAGLLIFADRIVAFNFRRSILMPQFGLLVRCDIDLILHEDIFELRDLEYKEVAVPLKDGQLNSCAAGRFSSGLW